MKVLFCIFALAILVYIGIFSLNIPTNLFENINIIQILTPIIQIFITLGIVYFVNIKLAKTNKSKDVLLDVLTKYEKQINLIYELAAKYISQKDDQLAHQIKWELKKTSIKVDHFSVLYDMFSEYAFIYELTDIKKELLELKQAITNDPFMQKDDYSSAQKSRILACFESIETNINREKINLFK